MANIKQFNKCNNFDEYKELALQRISHKRQEHTIIEYLWTKLNEVSETFIFFALQQYVTREDNGRFALLDAYLPQINVIIEVDEDYHLTQENRCRDEEREVQIKRIGGTLYRIRASMCLQKRGDSFIVLEDEMSKHVQFLEKETKKCKEERRFQELDPVKYNYLGTEYHLKKGFDADRHDAVENKKTMNNTFRQVKKLCAGDNRELEFQVRSISPNKLVSSDKCDLSHYHHVGKNSLQVIFVNVPQDILGQKFLLFAGVFEYQHEEWKLISKRLSFSNESGGTDTLASFIPIGPSTTP